MMRFILVLALATAALFAQTTVYLRSGTPGAFATISGASNTTPITITTTAAHGFAVGDLIYIQQVYGNWAANGLRKVASTPLATTYTITDINNSPIAGNGVYTFSGFAGKVTAHTIVGHPRLLFDGPSGPLTTVMNGSVTTSIRADPSWAVFQGMKYINDAHTGTADNNANIKSVNYDWGPGAFLLAEGWFMDRTQTAYLNTAKWFINNVEKRLAGGTTAGTPWYPGFFTASSFGRGSDLDWASHMSVEYMYAYSLIHDQLTPTERQTFADKILNNNTDYGESCTQPMTWQTGTFATTAGSTAIVGTGTDFTTLSGIGFAYIPRMVAPTYISPVWGYLPTITDATHATLPAAAATTNSNNIFFTVRPWQTGDCGWRWYVRNHQNSPMYDTAWLTVKLTAAIGGEVRFMYGTGFSNGYNHYAAVGSTTYSHVQIAGDTATTIITDLKNQINAAPDPNAVAAMTGTGSNIYLTLDPVSIGTNVNVSGSDGNSAVVLSGAGSTTLSVQALPAPKTPPYLMSNGVEFMQVTAQSSGSGCPGGTPCLTVVRGYGNSTPVAYASGKTLTVGDVTERFSTGSTLQVGPELVPYDDPRENLTMAKMYGNLAASLALADDDERARLMFEQQFNYWYDFTYPYDKRSWTGVTQSVGNPGYNRRQLWNLMLARMFLTSLSPAIDVTGGNWLRNTFKYFPALEVPGMPTGVFPFADSIVDPTYAMRHLDGLQIALGLFPTDPLAQKYNWWFRTRKNYNVLTTYNSIGQMEMASFGILLPGPSETQIGQTDYTATDPPHFTLNTVDLADSRQSPIGAWTSRTDWTDTATAILALSIQRPNDHISGYPGPGAYKIVKAGVILAGEAGPAVTNIGSRKYSNYLQTGGVDTPGVINGGGLIDRTSGDNSYAYIRVNNAGTNSQAYLASLGVQRAYRHLLHVKGSVDILFAYDDMTTSAATGKLQNFYFYSDNYETPTFSLTGCTATLVRPASQLITQYLLPASGVACNHPLLSGKNYSMEGNPGSVGRYKLHQLVVDAGNQSSVNMLAVHKAFSDTTSTMPTTTVLSTTSSHSGVQVAGANPVVVLFPKNGTTPSTSAGFTSTHTGTAAVYVTGMTPGNYSLTIDNITQPAQTADSSGVIQSSGTAGTYAFTDTDTPVALSIGTTTLANAVASGNYFAQLLGVGGTVPYVWAISVGTLPTGLNLNTGTGVISGIAMVAGASSFTIQLTDSANTVVTQAITLTVDAAPTIVGVTSGSSNPAVLSSGSVVIVASAVGGIAPFVWTLPTNTANCSPTTGSGNTFSTICTTPGNVDITVTDNVPNTADVTFVVTVPPLTATPALLTTRVFSDQTLSATGGVPSYSWSAPSAINTSGTGTTFTTSWSALGNYSILITDSASTTISVPVTVVTAPTPVSFLGQSLSTGKSLFK